MTRQLLLLALLITSGLGFFYFQKSKMIEKEPVQLKQLNSGVYFKASTPLDLPLSFENQDGQNINLKDFDNHYSIFFFGYSTCPSICPQITAKMSDLARALTLADYHAASRFHFYFVSIDPENDTRDQLHDFLSQYPGKIVGLRGDIDDILSMAEYFRAHVATARGEDGHIAHSASLVVLDPERIACAILTDLSEPEQVASDLLSVEKMQKSRFRRLAQASFQ